MATIPPKFVADNVVRDGAVYGIPAYITADGLMYNKRMFAAVGLDPNKPP
jgi:ABC-type glycerol-3-phosphate transport system substrate-binding protein